MKHKQQAGNFLVVGCIAVFVVLVLVGVAFFALQSNKKSPQKQNQAASISPYQSLTSGNSNQDLATDHAILTAGLTQDSKNLQTANTALNDQQITITTPDASNAAEQKQQLAALQSSATAELNRRVTALTKLLSLIQNLQQVKGTDQTALQQSVSSEITNLTNLNTKLNAETGLAAGEADATTLGNEYATYWLLEQKITIIAAADFQQTLEANLTTAANKIQDRLNTANNNGEDISSAQVLLNDQQSHVQTAQGISGLLSTILPVQVGQYNANHSVLASWYSQLQTAHTNIASSLDDTTTLLISVDQL